MWNSLYLNTSKVNLLKGTSRNTDYIQIIINLVNPLKFKPTITRGSQSVECRKDSMNI